MQGKTVSTRMSIIGRGANCRGGKSAVEQSAYISRTTQYSEYYAETYYPKYTEDLVHTDILLPDNAPERYLDRAVLWNSVEEVEKHSKAQLARLYKVSLPNAWPHAMAVFFMQDYIKRNFVSKGMCAEKLEAMSGKADRQNLERKLNNETVRTKKDSRDYR